MKYINRIHLFQILFLNNRFKFKTCMVWIMRDLLTQRKQKNRIVEYYSSIQKTLYVCTSVYFRLTSKGKGRKVNIQKVFKILALLVMLHRFYIFFLINVVQKLFNIGSPFIQFKM